MDGLDVIIPMGNLVPNSLESRVETINAVLSHFYARQCGISFNIIIVEQSMDGKIYYMPNIPRQVFETKIKKIEISYPIFNKSWCINVGLRQSSSRFILIADPDIFCKEIYFRELLQYLENGSWCFAWNKLRYTEVAEKAMLIDNGIPSMKGKETCGPKRGFSEGGLVLFKRTFFERMGMANEFIEELGGIDNEMMDRARHLDPGHPPYNMPIYHLWHEGSQKSTRPTRAINVKICRKCKANAGKMINIINRLDGGNFNAPYCKDNNLGDLWQKN